MGWILRALKGLLWPAGAPLFAALIYLHGEAVHPLERWWPGLILVTLALVVLVALRFGRGRVVAAATLMYFTMPTAENAAANNLQWTFVVVGLSLLLLSHLRDSGLFHWRAMPVWLVGGWAASLPLWPQQWGDAITRLMSAPEWLTWPVIEPLGVVSTWLAMLTGFGLFLRMATRAEAIESGFLGCFIGLWLSIQEPAESEAAHIFLLAAGLTLFLSLIERSHDLAYRDQLTGLPGRRALEENLAALGHRYTLAMVDVDRFKKFNDKYGHDAGDEVLRMVAARLKGLKGGRAYRYGGEEFTLVFPGRRLEEVVDHLESIRLKICDQPFTLRAMDRPKKKPSKPRKSGGRGKVKVSVSIGAAQARNRGQKPVEVLKTADQCLYKAKQGGRNRVIAA